MGRERPNVTTLARAIVTLIGSVVACAVALMLVSRNLFTPWFRRRVVLRRLRSNRSRRMTRAWLRATFERTSQLAYLRLHTRRRGIPTRDERQADVLDSIARELRLGTSLNAAVVTAIDRHEFAEWQWMAQSARQGDPLTAIDATDLATRAIALAADGCDAVQATESAARTLRANAAIAADSLAAVAQTRASMKVLTAVPLVIAAWLVMRDHAAREFFGSPSGLVCIGAGLTLQWIGRSWVARLTARAQRTDAEVPDFVDLLSLQVRSGRPPAVAFLRASDAMRGALGAVAQGVARSVRDGQRFIDALSDARPRFELRAHAVIDALIDTERDGLAPRAVFERLAHDAHQQRRREAEARIRALPVRLTLPLVGCVLPAYVVLAVIPLLASQFPSVTLDPL